jgi:hypothetical protein
VTKKGKKSQNVEQVEIKKQIKMAPEERQALARRLKEEHYGRRLPDVRDY